MTTRCPADRLTKEHLVKLGYTVDKAESYNAFSKRKKDLYQFIDYVAIMPGKEILAVQTTSKSNLSARIKKAESKKAFWHWLSTGNPVTFHGWYKDGHRWALKEIRREGKKSDLF